MLIPSVINEMTQQTTSLSRRVNANSQPVGNHARLLAKLIKKGEC